MLACQDFCPPHCCFSCSQVSKNIVMTNFFALDHCPAGLEISSRNVPSAPAQARKSANLAPVSLLLFLTVMQVVVYVTKPISEQVCAIIVGHSCISSLCDDIDITISDMHRPSNGIFDAVCPMPHCQDGTFF